MPAEMPGTTDRSMLQAAADAAETIAQMVKGGCDFPTAVSTILDRSPIFKGWVRDHAIMLAQQSLELQKVEVPELVRKFGQLKEESEKKFNTEAIENGDLVAFGECSKYYVLDSEFDSSYLWCSKNRSDRFNTEAQGFPVYRNFATEILEKGSQASFAPEIESDI